MSESTIRQLAYILSAGPGSITELKGKSVLMGGPDQWKFVPAEYENILLKSIIAGDDIKLVKPPIESESFDELSYLNNISAIHFPFLRVCNQCNSIFDYTRYKFSLKGGDIYTVSSFLNKINTEVIDYKRSNRQHSGESNKNLTLIEKLFCPKCSLANSSLPDRIVAQTNILFSKTLEVLHENLVTTIPFRFVAVCAEGHIFDLPVKKLLCEKNCNNHWFQINFQKNEIHCSSCKKTKTIDMLKEETKGMKYHSTYFYWMKAFHPPNNKDEAHECNGEIQVSMRGDRKIWYPINRSALKIFEHNISPRKREELSEELRAELEKLQRKIESNGDINNTIKNYELSPNWTQEFKNLDDNIIKLNIKSMLARTKSASDDWKVTEVDVRKVEYQFLKKHALFEKNYLSFHQEDIQNSSLADVLSNLIVIDKAIINQTLIGFNRIRSESFESIEDGEEKKSIFVPITAKDKNRYPTVETKTEGFFLELKRDKLNEWVNQNSKYIQTIRNKITTIPVSSMVSFSKDKKKRDIELAEFFLLHSLSHYLIQSLCFSSGYNAMSLRERLYFFDNVRGLAILTSSGDSEGSLGGVAYNGSLTRIIKHFESMLENLEICSNDPICQMSQPHGHQNHNFAACHACLILPETACEFMNQYLDRNSLIGSLEENIPQGFFRKE